MSPPPHSDSEPLPLDSRPSTADSADRETPLRLDAESSLDEEPAPLPKPFPRVETERFRILGEIAHGGMGVVMRVHDPNLGRELALKVVLPRHGSRPEMARRFLEEAQIAAHLQHPGIVPIHEMGRLADDRPFFTMKLVEGQTLAELLKARPDASAELPRWLKVFEQVCQTMAFAHSRGVIHRDLKPHNIMVGAFGEVHVMDWGLAKRLQSSQTENDSSALPQSDLSNRKTPLTQAGAVLGTYSYMAPEQARGEVEHLNERCDVFGLGAILCQILTGQPPYQGDTVEELRHRAETGALAEAWKRLQDCGAEPDLIQLARRCLAAEREQRPRHAGEVAEAMTAYLTGVQQRLREAELERTAAQVREQEARAKAVAERRARRLTIGLALAGLLLVAFGGVAAWWYQRDQAERARRESRAAADLDAALIEATEFHREAQKTHDDPGRWREAIVSARSALKRADNLARGAPLSDALRQRLQHIQAEVEQEERLRSFLDTQDEIRLARARQQGGRYSQEGAAERYRAAFARYGLDLLALPENEAAAQLRAQPLAERLTAAVHDWARLEPKLEDARRLSRVLKALDPAPGSFLNRWLDAKLNKKRPILEELARTADVSTLSATTVVLLSDDLFWSGAPEAAAALLLRAQPLHSGDFWINHHLALCLEHSSPPRSDEAIGYYRAALAVRPSSAGALLNLGAAFHALGRSDEATQYFRRAIALDPDYADAHSNLGVVLKQQGRAAEALGHFQTAVRLDPRHGGYRYALGTAHLDGGRIDDALRELNLSVRLAPEYAEAHVHLGRTLLQAGNWEEAACCFHHAFCLKPTLPQASLNLGSCFSAHGDAAEALTWYRTSIALAPTHSGSAYGGLGMVLTQMGRPAEGLLAFEQALRDLPLDSILYVNLGTTLHVLGRRDEALCFFHRAHVLDPSDGKAPGGLGMVLRDLGARDEALQWLRLAVHLDPREPKTLSNLGLALNDKGYLTEALDCFHNAVRMAPNLALLHVNLGTALQARNRDDALASFRRALELDPHLAVAHAMLGAALAQKGQVAEGIVHLRTAIALEPDYAPAHYNLGYALASQSRHDEAMACYRQTIRLRPNFLPAYASLGGLLLVQERFGDAVGCFRAGLRVEPRSGELYFGLGVALFFQGELAEGAVALKQAQVLLPAFDSRRQDMGRRLQAYQDMSKLEQQLPAYRDGKEKTRDVFTLLDLGWLCRRPVRQLYAASVTFSEAAFGLDSKLLDNVQRGYRYDAACAALQAGCGRGRDAPTEEKERSRLRQRALEWLRADLAVWQKMARSGRKADLQTVRGFLGRWRSTPLLAAVRDASERQKLPGEEAVAWGKLWQEVEALWQEVAGRNG